MTHDIEPAQTAQSELSIAIFSYNRGQYLRNLLDSISTHIPGVEVRIYDDNSDDPDTIHLLNNCGHSVYKPDKTTMNRHGNLYVNMQSALEGASTNYLIMLQNDLQIIRDFSDIDLSTIQETFENTQIGFLRPQFMRQGSYLKFLDQLILDSERDIYFPIKESEGVEVGNAYCDVMICSVQNLRAVNWSFEDSENGNAKKARQIFKHMPQMFNPFIFYCPEVPCYRNRRIFLASKIASFRLKGQIIKFASMTTNEMHSFINRNRNIPPVAEDFLRPSDSDVLYPFVFEDFRRKKFLLALYKVERRLNIIFSCYPPRN